MALVMVLVEVERVKMVVVCQSVVLTFLLLSRCNRRRVNCL